MSVERMKKTRNQKPSFTMSEAAERRLKSWLSGNRHTPHDLDMGRWFDFVDQLYRDGRIIDEGRLVEHIESLAVTNGANVPRQTIEKRAMLATGIIDFLTHTGRRDAGEPT